jgi:putative membrane protein
MRRFNIEEFFKFILLLGFSFFLLFLMLSGYITNFIHPKMIIYIKLACGALMILSAFQFTKVFTAITRNKGKLSHVLLAITIIIGFAVAPNGVNTSIAENKGVSLGNFSSGISKYNPYLKRGIINNTIVFNEEDYYYTLFDVAENIEVYAGKKVILTGFVYKEAGFKEDEFVVARMMLNCCAADTQVAGILCRWDKTHELKKEQWVRIEGILASRPFMEPDNNKEDVMPEIIVEKVSFTDKPENPYIYP